MNEFISVGFVVRNDKGDIKGFGVDRVEGNVTVDVAEVMAIRHALDFVRHAEFLEVILESDS